MPLQAAVTTCSTSRRWYAKQAGQGEGPADGSSAAEASSSSSGDEAASAEAAAELDMDVAELQELLQKAQEEVGQHCGETPTCWLLALLCTSASSCCRQQNTHTHTHIAVLNLAECTPALTCMGEPAMHKTRASPLGPTA